MEPHRHDIRIYYEDTDSGGLVYYANYLKYLERGRTELLRNLGFENGAMLEHLKTGIVVRRITAEYLKPARLDDMIRVTTAAESVKHASVTMSQSITRLSPEPQIMLVTANLTVACIDTDTHRPVRWPEGLRAGFETIISHKEKNA